MLWVGEWLVVVVKLLGVEWVVSVVVVCGYD